VRGGGRVVEGGFRGSRVVLVGRTPERGSMDEGWNLGAALGGFDLGELW